MKQTETIEQLIEQELNQLPAFVRRGILSVDWLGALQKVTHRHHLHVDKLDKVQKETILIILGIIDSVEFVGKVSEILDMKGEDLDTFIDEINTEVFLPVRDAILKEKAKTSGVGSLEREKEGDDGDNGESEEQVKNDLESHLNAKPAGLNEFQKKLTQKVHTPTKQTDYSVKRTGKIDPYHEPIE